MPNLGQMSPEEKQAYLDYLKSISSQQAPQKAAMDLSQTQMDMARSGDIEQQFGNQVGSIVQNMLGQTQNAQMFEQASKQKPLQAMVGEDSARFQDYLKNEAMRAKLAGEAKLHQGQRITDIGEKGEEFKSAQAAAFAKALSDAQEKKTAAQTDRDWKSEEHRLDRANHSANAALLRGIAGGKADAVADARKSLLPEGIEFINPDAIKTVKDKYIEDIQTAMEKVKEVGGLADRLEEIAKKAGGRSSFGSDAALAGGAYESLILELKELKKLGVLQEIDKLSLQKVVSNPLERKADVKSTYENDMLRLTEFKDGLKAKVDRYLSTKGLRRSTGAPQSPLGESASPAAEETVDMLNPDGVRLPVFKSKVEAAKKAKWKVING